MIDIRESRDERLKQERTENFSLAQFNKFSTVCGHGLHPRLCRTDEVNLRYREMTRNLKKRKILMIEIRRNRNERLR